LLRRSTFGFSMDSIPPGSPAANPSVFSKCGPLLQVSAMASD
jgi:hypothetical protein